MKIATRECRYGPMSYFVGSDFIGTSLAMYGEYSQLEVEAILKCLRPGKTVLDVGANIGCITVPMSKLVGPTGAVIAFEPHPEAAKLLRQNLVANGCTNNVKVIAAAASSTCGTVPARTADVGLGGMLTGERDAEDLRVKAVTIDSLNLTECWFMKIDVDGHEREVIKGARETIKKFKPIIYIENDRDQRALISDLIDLGYRLYWHRPPLYNSNNFAEEKRNQFGHIVSLMMCCIPEESGMIVGSCDEIGDIRDDDQMYTREMARYERYLARNPDDLDSRLMVAHLANLMQRTDYAYALFEENLRRHPGHVKTLGIKGLLDLQQGKWATGWQDYELRFKQANTRQFGAHRLHPVPKWDGTPTDKPVLVWSEQGFGDMLMFARFFKHVLARAPNAMLEVQPHLYELFEQSKVAPPGRLFRIGRSLPHYDFHCALPSTPAVLGADDAMMQITEPYLFADPMLAKNWLGKGNWNDPNYPSPLAGMRIGLCTRGSPNSERPFTRDIPVQWFIPLSKKYGPFMSLSQDGQFESFADTAAAVSVLDLVITVDTSVAHLAGAMGRPTWLLLSYDPDFRWGLKGDTTIWYPTMRIFRQPAFRDWGSVIEEVTAALEEFDSMAAAAE